MAAAVIVILLCATSCKKLCFHFKIDATVIPPTCTEEGKTVNQCRNCDYNYVTDVVPPTGHTIVTTTTAPDCEAQGYTTYSCECGYNYISDYLTPNGHTFTDTVVSADCDSEGYTVHDCIDCDYSYTDSYVSATGHTIEKTVTPPTCSKQGYTTYSCDCGYSYLSDYIAATGHTMTETVTEPTCTEEGYTTYSCECGYTYVGDHTEPKGHTYTDTVVEETCAEAGYTLHTCECGHEYKSDIISALGHSFNTKITMPTVSDMGFTEFNCKRCNFSYVGNYRFYSEILPNGAYAGAGEVLAKGIDISKFNHPVTPQGTYEPIDWNAIKAEGVDFVILKAGSSQSGIEPTFELDYAGAKAAGLDVGVYFYTYATTVSQIKADAQKLLNILDGKQFEYPIYLDLEDESLVDVEPSILTEMCVTFFSILQENGYYTGLYVNHEWLNNILQTEKMLDLFEIWYARYPQNVTEYIWDTSKYGNHLGMWQYTDSGSLTAIPEIDIDFNYAYKDYPTLIAKLGLNGLTVTE